MFEHLVSYRLCCLGQAESFGHEPLLGERLEWSRSAHSFDSVLFASDTPGC